MLIRSAQSESPAGYFGQDTAVQVIHAFSRECQQISGCAQPTPGCIRVEHPAVARARPRRHVGHSSGVVDWLGRTTNRVLKVVKPYASWRPILLVAAR